jgi:hypothetical protein
MAAGNQIRHDATSVNLDDGWFCEKFLGKVVSSNVKSALNVIMETDLKNVGAVRPHNYTALKLQRR